MSRRPRLLRSALAASMLFGALAGNPAAAIEPPPGTRNFTPPSSVPNYFSNEAAAFRGGARAVLPATDRFNIAPGPETAGVAAPSIGSRKAPASAGLVKPGLVKRGLVKYRSTLRSAKAALSKSRAANVARARKAARVGKAVAKQSRLAVRSRVANGKQRVVRTATARQAGRSVRQATR